MTAGRYERRHSGKGRAVPKRRPLILFLCQHVVHGAKMIINIDLDSWEAGYTDGHFGRPSQCPASLDSFSYSTGYCVGRAGHAGTDRNQFARRRALSFHR
jgi:hypothetical protein